MNTRIFFSGDNLIVDNSPFFIMGGEIEYFRMPKREWRDRLGKAAEGGLNTISTYIPRYFHEYEEGYFDFSGKTMQERDIHAFLEMTQTLKLPDSVRKWNGCGG